MRPGSLALHMSLSEDRIRPSPDVCRRQPRRGACPADVEAIRRSWIVYYRIV